jgi:hypothetical protein
LYSPVDRAADQDFEQALFDLLHGKALDDVQHIIDDFVRRTTKVIDYASLEDVFGTTYDRPAQRERIPAYKPIRFPRLLARMESPAFAVPFADTLDTQQPD